MSWGRRSCGSPRPRPPGCTTSGSSRRSSRRGEQRAELVRDRAGVVAQLAPGDADDAVAGERELAVASAVALERLARGVDGIAVELDDEALGRPQGVRVVRAEGLVHLGAWEAVRVDEGEEALFEDGSRDRLAEVALLEDAPERVRPPAVRMPRDLGGEGKRAREPADL